MKKSSSRRTRPRGSGWLSCSRRGRKFSAGWMCYICGLGGVICMEEREKILSTKIVIVCTCCVQLDGFPLYIFTPRYLRRRKKTTDTTDSGYDTTAAGILMMRKQQQNSTVKTLVAMARFKGNLSKEKQESSSDKRTTNAKPGEKAEMKQNVKEVTKAEKKILRYTNFSNLVDKRRRIRKEKAQIVTMKTMREIEILPRKVSTAEE